MIRGKREGKGYATWFVTFDHELDNGLIPPPLLSPANNNVHQKSPPTPTLDNRTPTLDNRTRSFSQSTSGTQTPLPEIDVYLDNKEKEKRDIYREAFESTKKTEEAKFKVRFDNLLSDMTKSIEKQSPTDGHIPEDFGNNSYGDSMAPYKRQIKDLLVSLSQRLELAVESFDESGPHSATLTSQKVRQMVSKLIEDRLGETLDLTISDEAVSDLSSLSDESGEVKSFEDQIAQAVIAKILEQQRHILQNGGININSENDADMEQQTDSSGSEEKMADRTMSSSVSEEKNVVDSVQTENLEKTFNICDTNQNVQNGDIVDYTDGENLDSEHLDVDDLDSENLHAENLHGNTSIRKTDKIVHRDKVKTKKLDNENLNRSKSGQDSLHIDRMVNDNLDTELTEDLTSSSKREIQSSQRQTDNLQRNTDSSQRNSDSSQRNTDSSQRDINSSRRDIDSSQRDFDSSQREATQHEPDEREILHREFEKLRTFAHEVVPRPLYEEIKMDEQVEQEPVVEEFDRVQISHEESQEEFTSRFFTYDKVHDPENRSLPDFSYFDDDEEHNFEFNEIDPDLLSMNLAPIAEETEEELEEDKDDETPYVQDWRGNWIFKGAQGISPYSNLTQKKVQGSDFPEVYMTIPKPNDPYIPRIGSRDVDDISDMSENDDRDSSDGLSDEENTFYSKTSEELARITRKSRKISSGTQASSMANTSMQTEDESEAESMLSHPLSTSFSDSGVKSAKMDHNSSFESRTNASILKKLSEELIPAEGDDPRFEIPPDSVTIPEGEPAKVMCRVAGTQPLDVFWYHVLEEAEELENSANYEITKDNGRHQLTMFNMTKADQGQYMCVAINEKGRCCQYFILNIKKNTQELKAPEFLKTLSDVEVAEGQSVKFRCKVKGYPQPRVTWYKDGQLLSSDLNCKLEKFGNRDYLLAIESATMDEDAEYSVLAKNIAGEVRSSAQLIVEPTNKPETESSKNISKNMSKREPEPESSEPPLIPRLPYLPSSRRSPMATKRSSSGATKEEQNLSNLSQKVSMTKESIGNVAEDILSSSKEHEAAENVRKATSAAMDILDSTDSVIMREKKMDALATSTPRSSVTEKILTTEDVSHVEHESELDTLNKSDNSHTSELSFSFTPVSSKPVSKVGDSFQQKTETQSTKKLQSQTVSPKITLNDSTAEAKHKTSPDVIENEKSHRKDLNSLQNSQDSEEESLFLNFGPKRESKEWYAKDYYITNTPQMQRRKSSESSDKEDSPRTEKQRARTEEKIYLTAGNVYNLENRVQSLADKVKAVSALAEQDKMERLENQVASTVAKVAHTEKEVKDVEKSVSKLTNKKQPTFKSKMAPPKPRPITPPQEKPEPTFLKGTTNEQDLPESRTEFNEEYGSIELPSVNRLKAMFGQSKEPDSSIRRLPDPSVHSITARSVPKDQLEKLRRNSNEDKDQHLQNVSSRSAEHLSVNPGRATAITTGQQIKQVPEGPKQVFQSSRLNRQNVTSVGASAIQKTKPHRQNIQITQKSQSPSSSSTTQSMKITLSNSVNRPLSPVQSEPVKQNSQPIKPHVARKAVAPQPPSQSNTPTQNVKTGSEIDTPEGRKSPKIKTGAISAMSKFWEKRFTDGKEDEKYPELLENN